MRPPSSRREPTSAVIEAPTSSAAWTVSAVVCSTKAAVLAPAACSASTDVTIPSSASRVAPRTEACRVTAVCRPEEIPSAHAAAPSTCTDTSVARLR
ncbi:MAG: hypothetical protein FWE61_02595 [Micrococcales bacterium]|nr:hypothetical protein [Micrococcales bacterium]